MRYTRLALITAMSSVSDCLRSRAPTITIGGQIADKGMDTGKRFSIIRFTLGPTILSVLRPTAHCIQLRTCPRRQRLTRLILHPPATRARALFVIWFSFPGRIAEIAASYWPSGRYPFMLIRNRQVCKNSASGWSCVFYLHEPPALLMKVSYLKKK